MRNVAPVSQKERKRRRRQKARIAALGLSLDADATIAEKQLRLSSVSPETVVCYQREVDQFSSWCLEQRLPLSNCRTAASRRKVDGALSKYFTQLYLKGFGVGKLRMLLHGYILLRTDLDGNASRPFPLANRQIRAVKKRRPGTSLDPWPEDAVLTLASKMLDRFGLSECMAVLIQYDSYLRTRNLLQIQRMHFSPPQPHAGPSFCGRFGLKVGTKGTPTKNGTFDHLLLLGDTKDWFFNALCSFYKSLPDGPVWKFDYARYYAMLEQCRLELGLDLDISPHLMRHSAASNDNFLGRRSLDEIQRRGFWLSRRSVAVYERHANLMRSVERLSPQQQSDCRQTAELLRQKLGAPKLSLPRKKCRELA